MTRPRKLAIVTSHPIQYNAPAFRELASRGELEIRVFYEWEGPGGESGDAEFGRQITWDIPLLEGYDHVFIPNVARHPGTNRFRGLENPSLVDAVTEWKPDAVLVYGWSFQSHVKLLRAMHGRIPVIFRGDSTLIDERGAFRDFARSALLRWIYRHVDIALYAGTANRAYFAHYGLSDSQLLWGPHAVDNDRFLADSPRSEVEAKAWRGRLGIGERATVFLFAAKLVPRKDPSRLLRAFMDLRGTARNGETHLIFVGEGELAADLRATARERADVHFLGFQNQSAMPVVYRIGDVTVLPSIAGETWGLAVNESMACGRPAIVSDKVGCAADLVKPGETGEVFAHSSLVGLRRTLERFVNLRDRTPVMGEAARELIAGWSIPAYCAAVEDAVVSVTKTNSPERAARLQS